MHRRAVISLLGAATISWPLSLKAQQVSKMARIGVFYYFTDNAVMGAASRAFLDEMRRRGFAERQNLRVELRHTERDLAALSADATELVGLKVDSACRARSRARTKGLRLGEQDHSNGLRS